MSWGYDSLGRVTSKGQTLGTVTKSVTYGYTSGNLTSMTTPSGQSVVYGYNSNHQVTSVSVNGTTVLSSVLYDPFGPVRGWTWGNGTLAVRTFDTDGKVTQIDSGGLKTYAYDDAFRITGITDTVTSANSYTYGYDALDRLTSAAKTGTTRGFTYDANGNRLTQTGTGAATYTISSSNNRVSSISGGLTRTYSYDTAGNVLTYATVTATYNNRGRMKTLKVGSSTETIVYNALGQRVKISGGGPGTVLYWYDEAGHLLGEYSSTGALVQETIWMGDIPIATLRPGTPALIYYVHTDHLNTPRRVTRPSDNKLMWTWYADPFGSDLPNENPASGGTFKYNLRFPGQLFDSHAGLAYNYFRDYDSAIGRYVESDPIGQRGGVNTYAYVKDRPIAAIDPRGLYVCTYSISAHSINCNPVHPGHAVFSSNEFVSGNNQLSSCQDCRDNPVRTNIAFHGPIPVGSYIIGSPTSAGGARRDLTPDPRNQMLGRDAFQLHGCRNPATCSDGCVAATTNATRDSLNNLLALEEGDNWLDVTP